jgi:hypothetical protein
LRRPTRLFVVVFFLVEEAARLLHNFESQVGPDFGIDWASCRLLIASNPLAVISSSTCSRRRGNLLWSQCLHPLAPPPSRLTLSSCSSALGMPWHGRESSACARLGGRPSPAPRRLTFCRTSGGGGGGEGGQGFWDRCFATAAGDDPPRQRIFVALAVLAGDADLPPQR